ncbi:hypothetical protein [Desulforhopalus singaporensis]|uniref:Uncharacterized protein n=1 Tax=Desulforhopalus singaporensis TaxID=91360 RepID=A0A1H0ML52_9BACT|nr:hypothetical protein [Desulforhopalus singaporensis]SDO80996.1 hypothetical protein SAMN05660330_01091 [Desulforhopalus singaporensis]
MSLDNSESLRQEKEKIGQGGAGGIEQQRTTGKMTLEPESAVKGCDQLDCRIFSPYSRYFATTGPSEITDAPIHIVKNGKFLQYQPHLAANPATGPARIKGKAAQQQILEGHCAKFATPHKGAEHGFVNDVAAPPHNPPENHRRLQHAERQTGKTSGKKHGNLSL